MIGLPSALFAKLIAAIKVGSGDVIQFNSVLMPRLKALSMCDNFGGVCHRLGMCRRRDNAALDCHYIGKSLGNVATIQRDGFHVNSQ